MEVDLRLFESEVIAALEQDQETRPSKRARHGEPNSPEVERNNLPTDGIFPAYEPWLDYPQSDQWLDYPAYERRYKSPSFDIVQRDSPPTSQLVIGEDDENGQNSNSLQHNLPSFFHPNLGMTTALLESNPFKRTNDSPAVSQYENNLSRETRLEGHERLDLVPNFYFYAITSTLLPIRRVQHDLVILYFQHIHPMFPVVDEYYFMETYRKYRGKEQFMEPSTFMIYQAIMAAGFGHISEAQLLRTPYRSVHEGQKAQFDQVKVRYWSESLADPVVLTQVCLIISLWSPSSAGAQNNSYWLNLAFKHATAGEIWKSQPGSDGRPCRRRLLWWCCLVRDRVLALGMRRPYRLHKAAFEEEMISQLDFGLEATFPSFAATQSKQTAMLAFIWLCKLSEIMAAIAVFQRRNRFSRDWNGESADTSTKELKEVRAFDEDLGLWKVGFEAEAKAVSPKDHGHQDIAVPFTILRIVSNSLLAVLYSPYLHLSWDEDVSSVTNSVDPLQRMKEAAQAVESIVIGLISTKKSDTLPNWLVSWVTLPAAIYHVTQHVRNNSSPDRVLMPTLNRFMRRTTGAQAMFLTLTKATKEFLHRLNENHSSHRKGVAKLEPVLVPAPPVDRFEQIDAMRRDMGDRITEARILAHVTKALDSALELEC